MSVEYSENYVELLIKAKIDNFDPALYLMANHDLLVAKVDPLRHFQEHGIHEARNIINPELKKNSKYRKNKFDFFKGSLAPYTGDESFPISFGSTHFNIGQYDSEPSNDNYEPFEKTILRNPDKLFMDLGCGKRSRVYNNCLYVEVYNSISADVIVEPDIQYPFNDESFDGIGSFAVLEHVRRPWDVIKEIHRMLKPDGVVFIVWPFLQPLHGYPNHFFNASREGLCSIFEDNSFDIIECKTEPFQTPDYTVSWILNEMSARLPANIQEKLKRISVGELMSSAPGSELWLEIIKNLNDDAISTFACGNTLLAKKK